MSGIERIYDSDEIKRLKNVDIFGVVIIICDKTWPHSSINIP